jgi:hypothetical protein
MVLAQQRFKFVRREGDRVLVQEPLKLLQGEWVLVAYGSEYLRGEIIMRGRGKEKGK